MEACERFYGRKKKEETPDRSWKHLNVPSCSTQSFHPSSTLLRPLAPSLPNTPSREADGTLVPLLNVPFSPLVISLGGTVENTSLEAMEAWKEVVGEASHQCLMRRISVVLARARARVWQFE
jgi:hypothetical protein